MFEGGGGSRDSYPPSASPPSYIFPRGDIWGKQTNFLPRKGGSG